MSRSAFRNDLGHEIKHAAREARPWIAVAARIGYAARGIVYLLVGGLAFLSALGKRGEGADQKDALRTVLEAPAGDVLLIMLAVGFVCFAVWRFIQAGLDPDHRGHNAKGYMSRIALAVGGVIHIGLAVAAWRGGGGNDGEKSWTAWLLAQSFGPWLVGIVGAIVIGAGIAQGVKAVKLTYEKNFDLNRDTLEKLRPLFRFGLLARGFVFATIGVFFLYAAWTYDPQNAGGLREVFDEVRSPAFGSVMLGLLAAGLIAFGVYGLALARWRRIDISAT